MDPVQLPEWMIIPVLAGLVTPFLTGFATKLSASAGTKAVVALAVTALVAVIDSVVRHGGGFVPTEMAVLWATTFATHAASYFGAWKPIGGGAAPGAAATADIGLG